MQNIILNNRELTSEEYQQVKSGFNTHAIEKGAKVQSADRYTYVATEGGKFIGCASGLAYKNGNDYSGWFYLTDLFLEKGYRRKGLGARILRSLEEEIKAAGVMVIWTWTAGYEAPGFYIKQGYDIFMEMENWYSDGSGRIGLRKDL